LATRLVFPGLALLVLSVVACGGSTGADDTRVHVPDVVADFSWGGREVRSEPADEVRADLAGQDAHEALWPDTAEPAPDEATPDPGPDASDAKPQPDVSTPDAAGDAPTDASLDGAPDVAPDLAPDLPAPVDTAEPEPDLPPVPDTAECSVDGHCDDGKPCTVDTCVAGACKHVKAADNSPCEDGNSCTAGDYCVSGLCFAGALASCDDGNLCTTDTCVQGVGCKHAPKTGGLCDDGDACSGNDTCVNGTCQKGPIDLCPICGDGTCGEPYETCEDCVADCGACSETACADGVDEDWDGATDCDDSDCEHVLPCYEAACGDTVDNDADGTTDCADPDCGATEPCIETSCADSIDNDNDGATDCADSQCAAAASCLPAACASVAALTCGQTKDVSISSTNHLSGYTGCSVQTSSKGDDLYVVILPAGKTSVTASVSIDSSSDDLDVYLLKATCVPSSCVDSSTSTSTSESVSASGTPGQIFFVVVEEWSSSSYGDYSISISCD